MAKKEPTPQDKVRAAFKSAHELLKGDAPIGAALAELYDAGGADAHPGLKTELDIVAGLAERIAAFPGAQLAPLWRKVAEEALVRAETLAYVAVRT